MVLMYYNNYMLECVHAYACVYHVHVHVCVSVCIYVCV